MSLRETRTASRRKPSLWRRLAFWRSGNRRTGRRTSSQRSEKHRQSPLAAGKVASDKARSWRWLAQVAGALAVTTALVGATILSWRFIHESPHFAVRSIVCSPVQHVSIAALQKRSGVALGTNLFRLDLAQVQRNLRAEPWLQSVRVHRELPSKLVLEVTEQQPVALASMESLYLVNAAGELFKRATPQEYPGLPVLTGIGRAAYLMEREQAQQQLREALHILQRYQLGPGRPRVGEAYLDRFAGVTLYTDQGVAIRLGRGSDEELAARLHRLDVVLAALRQSGQTPSVLFLDNRAHADLVTVRLATAR